MPRSHCGGAGLCPTPSSPCPHSCFSPLPTVGLSLLFQLTLHWCGERAFDIHNLVQRRSRSPESLYGFYGNRLVQRTRCSAASAGGGEGKHIVKSGSTSVAGVGPTPFKGGRERLGKALGSLQEGLPLPTHWGYAPPPQELLSSLCGSWQVAASPMGFLTRCQGLWLPPYASVSSSVKWGK